MTSPTSPLACTLRDDANPPPRDALIALGEDAWAGDYARTGRAVFKYTDDYLSWLSPPGHHFFAWATEPDGAPCGCLLHVDRDLFCKGRWYRAAYGSLLAVAQRARGQRLGERLMHQAFAHLFGSRGVELEVGFFDYGQAGRVAITKAVRSFHPDFDIVETPPMAIWAATPSLVAASRYEPLQGLARLVLTPGVRRLFEARPARAPVVPVDDPAVPDREDLARRFTIGFGFGGSVDAMYPSPARPSAGRRAYHVRRGRRCLLAYHVITLAKRGLPDGDVGVLQFVDAGDATASELVAALRSLQAELFAAGCFTVLALDTGVLSKAVLLRARFVPTPRRVCLEIAGRRADLDPFRSLPRPYFLDLF